MVISNMPNPEILRNLVYVDVSRDFHLQGLLGILELEIGNVSERCANLGLEFAPVKNEGSRDFLASFGFSPLVDFTIVRFPSRESFVVTYGFEKERISKLISEFADRTGFVACAPTSEFVNRMTEVRPLEKRTYLLAEQIARVKRVNVENAVGAIRYTSFLSNYKNYFQTEAMANAFERFGIK